MSRIAYVNGRYLPHSQACIHVEDRGFQFADAVYEVWAVFSGRLAEGEGHFQRLERSLGELKIRSPMSSNALARVLRETVRRNRVTDGIVYLQISRGQARRDHAFPSPATAPTVVATARRVDFAAAETIAARGVAVVTRPDDRWGRCDIKTVSLLPNVLAKEAAHAAQAHEAWLVDASGLITEGASTNAWIVDQSGTLCTRDAGANILRGVTRGAVLQLASELQIRIEERPFSVEEAKQAREAFLTAASAFVTPIVSIDSEMIGEGRPGPVAQRLRALYLEHARREAV